MNSILREEVQTALNKRIGCGLNVSFNSEQYGSEELLQGDQPMAAVSEEA